MSGCGTGCRLGGRRAGPTLLVATGPGLYHALHGRLLRLPSLPWMRGSMILARLAEIRDTPDDGRIDDIVALPQSATDPVTIAEAYWTVLRKATAMGMIDGRGVPATQSA